MDSGSVSRRMCVAGGCSRRKADGVSLHQFPFDRPAILRQWTTYVKNSRKNWTGPTSASVLCSVHFSPDSYPAKYRIMESMGVPVQRKELERDAVPTVKIQNPEEKTPATGKRKADDFKSPLMSSTPKKPRRAFQKRETRRILLDSVMVTQIVRSGPKKDVVHTDASANDPQSPAVPHQSPDLPRQSPDVPRQSPDVPQQSPDVPQQSPDVPQQSPDVPNASLAVLQEPPDVSHASPDVPHQSPDVEQDVSSPKETRSVGCQRSLQKPQRRSHYTQTKWKTCDKEVQAVPKVKTREIGVSCNLLPAPPLHAQPIEVPVNESFASEETESEQDELEETDYSFESTESDETVESDLGSDRDRKFLVYECQLMELFANCPSCAQPTYGEIKQLKGSFISITQDCRFCFYQRTWSSQPLIGSIPAGNFEISCALLFSGSLPSKAVRMFKFLNMASISYRTFMYHQQCYLHPAVTEVWRDQQASYVQEARASGRQLHLGGDGRADTPGHCAKFGSYTLMDLAENVVVDLQLIQSNEVGGSCLMEKEGLIRGVRYLEENGLPVSQIVTDRHLQVAKWMRENLPDTTHSIDVWHVAKGFKKKLLALSKEKDCEHLREWIKSLVNHLYWVPSSAPDDEDSELRWEKWTSITNHVQNIHEGHGQHFQRCEHGDLDPASRRKRWLRPGTKVMEKLEAIVNSRQMKKDIPMLSSSFQTSSVEAFHSVINQFAPKMYKFSYFGMQSRLALAALHFNENSSKDQAATREGNLQYSIVFPKHKKGDYTVKKVKTQSTYEYVDVLTNAAKTRASNMKMPQCGDAGVAPPPLCDQYVHPEKDDAVGQLLTRFRRN